jgi:SAM-dependent methyltransferase
MGCVQGDISNDLFMDQRWSISKSSGLVQLDNLVPLEILYPESHGSGGIGKLWEEHHAEFANFIQKVNPKSVLEIGGAHGLLAREYMNRENIDWVIIEPNPVPVEGCRAQFINKFFDESFSSKKSFDAVIHSHVLEHLYEPNKFMENLSKFIDRGKYLIFTLPNMKVMLENKYTNCLNFEHTVFITEPYIEYLLLKNGFEIHEKKYFKDDHSIFYKAIKTDNYISKDIDPRLYEENKKLYLDYKNSHLKSIKKLNEEIEEFNGPIYLFGAHIFSQYLIVNGLKREKIKCILDNDPRKWNKRLYGTSLDVRNPSIMEDDARPIVILRAGVYNQEIKDEILKKINSKTIFI